MIPLKGTIHNISTREEILGWKLRNRGMLAAIARHTRTSKIHVSRVLHRKYYSSGGIIEGLLADLGAPGMRAREQEARLRGPDGWTKQEIKRLSRELKRIQNQKRRKAA